MAPILAWAALATGVLQTSPEVLWIKQSATSREHAVLIRAAMFSEKHVVSLCRSYLDLHREAAVIRYLIVTDEREAFQNLRGSGITDIDFSGWRQLYLAQSPRPPATAEMIRIRNRASVRMRFSDGRIAERILEYESPFAITFQSMKVRITGLALNLHGPSSSTVELFVQSPNAWSKRVAEAFSRMVRQFIGIRRIAITIEDGWWFAGQPNYPIYNRFLPYLEPPTFEEFKRHHRFYCEESDGRCLQMGPAAK